MKALTKRVVLSILTIAATGISAWAQSGSPIIVPSRFDVGFNVMMSQPKEDFSRNVGTGWGGGGSLLYHIDRAGWLSLRFDGSGIQYGHEKKRAPISQTIGSRILLDVDTTNYFAVVGVGPEFAVPRGRVRPYVNVGVSHLYFRTTSSLSGSRSDDEPIFNTTNYKDGTRTWTYGGGTRVLLWNSLFQPTLDLGVRYSRGGEASYLREGSITDHPDGSITISPLRSTVPYVAYVVGFRFQIPYSSRSGCPRLVC